LFLLVVTLSLHFSSFCQDELKNTTEAGITIGPMVFLGDLGGHIGKGTTFIKDYNMSTTKLAFGAYFTAYPAPWLGFRFSLNYGSIEGADNEIKQKGGTGDEQTRLARNLDFRSKIIEGTVMAEVYPTVFLEDEPDDVTGRLRPYGVIGLGLYHFNPQGSYHSPNGDVYWVDLKPLHTEGQGFPEYPDRKNYSLTQLNIPMGAGIKYFFSENVNVSFEIIHRKTFTDYIDDVSTKYVDPSLFYAHLSPQQAAPEDIETNLCTEQLVMGDPQASPSWNGWGNGPANTRFQPKAQGKLTAADLPRLQLKWAFGFTNAMTARPQPTVVGGRLFAPSENGHVYALNPRTGCRLQPKPSAATPRCRARRGIPNPRAADRLLRRHLPADPGRLAHQRTGVTDGANAGRRRSRAGSSRRRRSRAYRSSCTIGTFRISSTGRECARREVSSRNRACPPLRRISPIYWTE